MLFRSELLVELLVVPVVRVVEAEKRVVMRALEPKNFEPAGLVLPPVAFFCLDHFHLVLAYFTIL